MLYFCSLYLSVSTASNGNFSDLAIVFSHLALEDAHVRADDGLEAVYFESGVFVSDTLFLFLSSHSFLCVWPRKFTVKSPKMLS